MTDQLYIASGKRAIQLTLPRTLMGYRNLTASAVDAPLEINASVLWQDARPPIFMLSTDVLYVTDAMKHAVMQALAKRNLVNETTQEDHFFWGATHNHHAPACDENKPGLGTFDAEFTDTVLRETIDLLSDLLTGEKVGVRMYFGTQQLSFSTNRRRRVFFENMFQRQMRVYPNLTGPADHTAYAFAFKDASDTIRSSFVFYGCHTVSYFDRTRITADYPGVIRESLRTKLTNPDLPVLFFQGLSGNVNPRKFKQGIAHLRNPVDILNRLLFGPTFAQFDKKRYQDWAEGLARSVSDLVTSDMMKPLAPDVAVDAQKVPLETFLAPLPVPQDFKITRLQLSAQTAIYGFGAEVFAEYKTLLENLRPDETIIPATCIGDTFGYLPMERHIPEGGYEVERFQEPFSINDAKFISSPDETVKRLVDKFCP